MHTIYAAVVLLVTMVFGLVLRRTLWWATLWMAQRHYLPRRRLTANSVPHRDAGQILI